MSRPSYIATNYAEDASITMSNESAVHPPANSVDRDFASVIQWTADGSNWVEYDLVDAQNIDGVFVGNHNFASGSFAMTIKVGNSSPASTTVGTPAWAEKDIFLPFTSGSYRYVRIEHTTTQPTDVLPQAGQIVIGDRTVLPRGIRFGEKPHQIQEGVLNRTNRGKRYALELYQIERRAYSFRFPESEMASFFAWWEAVRGMLDPFVWCPVDGGTEGLYVAIEDEGFLPDELAEQALDPVLDWRVTLAGEGRGGEIRR